MGTTRRSKGLRLPGSRRHNRYGRAVAALVRATGQFICRDPETELVMLPLFPVTVNLPEPPFFALSVTVAVRVDVPPPTTLFELKAKVSPVGRVVAVSATVPLNPLKGVTVTV